MTTFIILGVVGLALLLVGVFFDGIFDGFDFGDGFLSLTSVAAFLSAFGFTSVIALNAGASMGLATGIGLAGGLLIGALAGIITRFLTSNHSESAPTSSSLVGSKGVVITPLVPGRYGEVSVNHAGHRVKMGALSDEPLDVGSSVEVVVALSSTSVKVKPVE